MFFFELSKFLNFFLVSPISWIFFLLAGFYFSKKKSVRKTCLIVAIAIFVVFTNQTLVNYVLYRMTREYAVTTIKHGKQYNVAIVMGGFGSINPKTGQLRYESERADRLWEAVRLWREGVVKNILITGDPSSQIKSDGSTTAPQFLTYMEEMGVPQECFILEQQAANTRQNAVNTMVILKQRKIKDKDCLLVTSAIHVNRSLKCFAKEGVHLDYMPVNIYELPSNLNHRALYPTWEAAVLWEGLFNEWIGDFAYRIKGYY
ncbi:MAG: YdcF family protein [Muribaculaceae bacterium]